jgi:hypothetical protein
MPKSNVNLINAGRIKQLVLEGLGGNRSREKDFAFVCNHAVLSGVLSNYPNEAIKIKDLLEIMDIIVDEWREAK